MNQNQFNLSVVKGMLDQAHSFNTLSCKVKSDESNPLVSGQKVKIVDSANGVPEVTALEADTDKVFGVVNYNMKDASFKAGAHVEISAFGNVIYLEASAAIARGADVMPVITGEKIATATEGKSVIGYAYDKATADGDLVRVMLMPQASLVADGYTPQSDIADLNQDISVGYVEAEVQAISDKVDAMLAALRSFGVLV